MLLHYYTLGCCRLYMNFCRKKKRSTQKILTANSKNTNTMLVTASIELAGWNIRVCSNVLWTRVSFTRWEKFTHQAPVEKVGSTWGPKTETRRTTVTCRQRVTWPHFWAEQTENRTFQVPLSNPAFSLSQTKRQIRLKTSNTDGVFQPNLDESCILAFLDNSYDCESRSCPSAREMICGELSSWLNGFIENECTAHAFSLAIQHGQSIWNGLQSPSSRVLSHYGHAMPEVLG